MRDFTIFKISKQFKRFFQFEKLFFLILKIILINFFGINFYLFAVYTCLVER